MRLADWSIGRRDFHSKNGFVELSQNIDRSATSKREQNMAGLAAKELDVAEQMSSLRVSDGKPRVIHDFNKQIQEELDTAFRGVTTLALDAEGVDLSRAGRISILQLATPQACFLFDVLDKAPDDPLVAWLRKPLEDSTVIKVIHDCRMDSDALFHLLRITLTRVHDTSCWMTATTSYRGQSNLNDTLEFYGLKTNAARDGSVYKDNHAFWATRPLTPTMVEWAAGDVRAMFELQLCQLKRATRPIVARVEAATDDFLTYARLAQIATVKVRPSSIGRFIGKRGANLRALEACTKTKIYNRGNRSMGEFIVFYYGADDLVAVQAAAASV
jgi:exonuclease 3'-5' domain-containing protein 1